MSNWTEYDLLLIWQKGDPIPGFADTEWRVDYAGNYMRMRDYGDRNSVYGWEVDHILPVRDGGTDDLWNLRPVNWKTNVAR